jgi:WD40 repeat protein
MHHDGEVNCVAFHPKGDVLLSASTDFTARLWHAATAKPIGPALRHAQDVSAVSCSPDGRIVATISDDNSAGLWAMPVPVTDDPNQIWRWAQRITGLTLGEDEAFHVLSPKEFAELTPAGEGFDHPAPSGRP